MLSVRSLEVINSRRAWLFMGSGASIDAGLPGWGELVEGLIASLREDKRDDLLRDPSFQKLREREDYPRCLSRIETVLGDRQKLEAAVSNSLARVSQPGRIHRTLADWPFEGYITTNYDHLLEEEMRSQRGWLSVGNTPAEVRKVSGDARDIIWHIHGSINLSTEASRLALTEKDYDELYLEGSFLPNQLRALLSQRRFVFVGFGFTDPALRPLLRMVGAYTIPERPIYAFLGSPDWSIRRSELEDLRDRYNVEVIPYRIVGGSHAQLRDLLDMYGAMVVRRSVTFGQAPRLVPSYDADTHGLLLYNSLVLQQGSAFQSKVVETLVSSRLLSLIAQEPRKLVDITAELGASAFLLEGRASEPDSSLSTALDATVKKLSGDRLIQINNKDDSYELALTDLGREFVETRVGTAARIRSQFEQSLTSRSSDAYAETGAAGRIAHVAAKFFRECIDQRSLGVAMATAATSDQTRAYQMAALLQSLPAFLSELSDHDEARAAISVVQGVLANPSDAERRYIGLLLQGRFAVHILGLDPTTLRSRTEELSNSIFILDSTTTIPLLARGATGHEAAIQLIRRARLVGAQLVTTHLLAEETREHADWSLTAATRPGQSINENALDSLAGISAERTNAFLEGFSTSLASGVSPIGNFFSYMSACGFPNRHAGTGDCTRALNDCGVQTLAFEEWPGVEALDYVAVNDLMQQITTARRIGESYRHERQVRAEAEVIVAVDGIRQDRFSLGADAHRNAFFVSNSRFLDFLNRPSLPITMKEGALLHWLGTIIPVEESELASFTDGLLWELSERGFDIVDHKRLMYAFPETISASQQDYVEVRKRHRDLVATRYGVAPSDAFTDPVDAVDTRRLSRRHYAQIAALQEESLKQATARIATLEHQAGLTEKQKLQLKRAQDKANERRRRAKARQRTKESTKTKR